MRERTRRVGVVAGIFLLLAVIVAGLASGGGRPADRAYELEQRLRCPVCKTVSIAESMSDTAVAMRATVEEQIGGGRSDAEIIDYFQARYGEWVLLDPPTSGNTLALWLIPVAAAGIGVMVLLTRPRRRRTDPAELSAADRERVFRAVAQLRATSDPGDQL